MLPLRSSTCLWFSLCISRLYASCISLSLCLPGSISQLSLDPSIHCWFKILTCGKTANTSVSIVTITGNVDKNIIFNIYIDIPVSFPFLGYFLVLLIYFPETKKWLFVWYSAKRTIYSYIVESRSRNICREHSVVSYLIVCILIRHNVFHYDLPKQGRFQDFFQGVAEISSGGGENLPGGGEKNLAAPPSPQRIFVSYTLYY